MGFFDLFKQSNINQGIEEYKRTDDAVLLDVRTPQEYQEGHIPESKNVPLQQLDNIASVAKNKDGGLDLSSTTDLICFCLVFQPEDESEPYYILPYYWLPEETLPL